MGTVTMASPSGSTGGRALVRSRYADVTIIPFQFTFVGTYATNGDTGLTLPTYKDLISVHIPSKNGYNFQLDIANSKIKVYTSGGTETTNATDLTGLGQITGFLVVRA